jgi:NAD(P)H-flavin reductase
MQPNKSKLEIVDKKKINHDCYIYSLKWADEPFFLSIGQHFRIVETIPTFDAPEGEEVSRKYTPISPCSQKVSST